MVLKVEKLKIITFDWCHPWFVPAFLPPPHDACARMCAVWGYFHTDSQSPTTLLAECVRRLPHHDSEGRCVLLGYCPGRVRRRVHVPSCVHRAAQGRVQILFRRIEMGDMPDGKRVRDGHGSIRTVRSGVCYRGAA